MGSVTGSCERGDETSGYTRRRGGVDVLTSWSTFSFLSRPLFREVRCRYTQACIWGSDRGILCNNAIFVGHMKLNESSPCFCTGQWTHLRNLLLENGRKQYKLSCVSRCNYHINFTAEFVFTFVLCFWDYVNTFLLCEELDTVLVRRVSHRRDNTRQNLNFRVYSLKLLSESIQLERWRIFYPL
jgi:hypothetical protein